MKLKSNCNWKQYICHLLREHQHERKTFVAISGFCLWGRGIRVNLLAKENLSWKYFFRYIKGWKKSYKSVKTGLILDAYSMRIQFSFWIFLNIFFLHKINSHVGCPKLCIKKIVALKYVFLLFVMHAYTVFLKNALKKIYLLMKLM